MPPLLPPDRYRVEPGAPVRMGFVDPAGRSTGHLFPTGRERDRLARDLVSRADPQLWEFLVDTIGSDEDVRVRTRCLEILAAAASTGGGDIARQVLALLGGESPRQRTTRLGRKGASQTPEVVAIEGATG